MQTFQIKHIKSKKIRKFARGEESNHRDDDIFSEIFIQLEHMDVSVSIQAGHH